MRLIPHFLTITLACASLSGAAFAGGAASAPASVPDTIVVQEDDRLWWFSGTARYVHDRTGEEKSMSVSGLVEAGSRGEARKLAKESGRAQAARRGRVISVNIRTIW